MSLIGPPGPIMGNLAQAIAYQNLTRSAFNWNYIADSYNITPGVERIDVDGFIRDRAEKAYHNNDFTAEQDEGSYTKSHYNMADTMIYNMNNGYNRTQAYDNADQESIDNRVFSLDDSFATGRPTSGTVIENPYIRQQIYINESNARVRHITPLMVPSKPYNELSAPGYSLRENRKLWDEYQRDEMIRVNKRLIKRDGSAEDTYDIGAPARLEFGSTRVRTVEGDDYNNIAELKNAATIFGKTNPMFGSSNPIASSDIKLSRQGENVISQMLLWPGGVGDFVYEIPDQALNNVPIRALALLRVLDGANVHDYTNMDPSEQLQLATKMTNVVNRFYHDRPDLATDQVFNEAAAIFSKQVALDAITDRLDPVNTLESNDQYQNILTQMNIAPWVGRPTGYNHTVDMNIQQQVAMNTYGQPTVAHAIRDYEQSSDYEDATKFVDLRARLFTTRDTGFTPTQGIDALEIHENTLKYNPLHFNLAGQALQMEPTVLSNAPQPVNGARGGVIGRSGGQRVYQQQTMSNYTPL